MALSPPEIVDNNSSYVPCISACSNEKMGKYAWPWSIIMIFVPGSGLGRLCSNIPTISSFWGPGIAKVVGAIAPN